VRAARALDPDADVRDVAAADLPGLLDLTTPSLFGELRLVVVRGVHELAEELRDGLLSLATSGQAGVHVVLVHPGGQKGRKLVDAAKAAGAQVVSCTKVDKVGDRIGFVQGEFTAAGRPASPGACRALVEAVGGDLRELAAACEQLAADTAGQVDERAVARYFRGRADASGFVVADRAIEGDVPGALTELRLARQVGVDPVLVVAALARQIRNVARVASAGRAAPDAIARDLKLAPWMVDKARRQSRGWTPATLAAAHRAVAEADAEVKGAGSDPAYAVERAVLAVATGRGGRT
jgi:DNA polymerase-3 subunit delta